MTAKRVRESYDAAKKLAEIEAALAQMEATQKPGEGAKKSKPEILAMAAERITALLAKGYTQSQIAQTLETAGVFTVRPQAIVDAAGVGRKPPAKRASGTRGGGRSKRTESQPENPGGGAEDRHDGVSAAQAAQDDDRNSATPAATNNAREATVAAQRTTEHSLTASRYEPSFTRRAPIIGD